MRGYYLKPSDNIGGCRGGVGTSCHDGEYDVEIGQQCNCSFDIMALMVHADELREYLALMEPQSAIAAILVASMDATERRIRDEYEKSKGGL